MDRSKTRWVVAAVKYMRINNWSKYCLIGLPMAKYTTALALTNKAIPIVISEKRPFHAIVIRPWSQQIVIKRQNSLAKIFKSGNLGLHLGCLQHLFAPASRCSNSAGPFPFYRISEVQ